MPKTPLNFGAKVGKTRFKIGAEVSKSPLNFGAETGSTP